MSNLMEGLKELLELKKAVVHGRGLLSQGTLNPTVERHHLVTLLEGAEEHLKAVESVIVGKPS